MERLRPKDRKVHNNRNHALTRAVQRYPNLRFCPQDILAWEEIIRGSPNESCRPLRTSRNHPDRTLWAVRHGETWIPVLFDSRTGSALTVFQPDALHPYSEILPKPGPGPALDPPPPDSASRIVGFAPLRDAAEDIRSLPPLPDVPPESEPAEAIQASLDAAVRRVEAIESILSKIPRGKFNPRREGLIEEKERALARLKDIKAARHAACQRRFESDVERARTIAATLYPEMQRIDAEAEFAGQVAQDQAAERQEWIRQVAGIVRRYL